MGERVDDRRLRVASQNEARSAVRLQILCDRGDPFAPFGPESVAGPASATPIAPAIWCATVPMSLGFRGSRWSARAPVEVGMLSIAYNRFICSASSGRRRAAKSRAYRRLPGPEARKSASSARMTSARSNRYCASAYSPKASFAPPRAFSRLAGSHWCHFADGYRASRSRICAASVGELTDSVRMRSPAPLSRLLGHQHGADRAEERRPWTDLAEVRQRLRSIRIVQTEHGGLRERVAGAEAAGMQRVAFDFRRPTLVAFDEEPGCDAAEWHGRRIEERLARDELFGLSDVRNDVFRRLSCARTETRERERRAHQLQKRAALDGINDHFDPRGKFLLQELPKSRIVRLLLERPPEFTVVSGHR